MNVLEQIHVLEQMVVVSWFFIVFRGVSWCFHGILWYLEQ
jgi:hypothetical protein